jgi:hypothetical protein
MDNRDAPATKGDLEDFKGERLIPASGSSNTE